MPLVLNIDSICVNQSDGSSFQKGGSFSDAAAVVPVAAGVLLAGVAVTVARAWASALISAGVIDIL